MGTFRRAAGAVLLLSLLAGCGGAPQVPENTGPDVGAPTGASTGVPTSAPTGVPTGSPSPWGVPSPPAPGGGRSSAPGSGLGKGAGVTTVTGRVEFRDIEGGCLVLVAGAATYQLVGVDQRQARPGTTITVRGRVLTDVATICQIGPVFEVTEIVPG